MNEQQWRLRNMRDTARDAARQPSRYSTSAMRAHDQKVSIPVTCLANDRVGDVVSCLLGTGEYGIAVTGRTSEYFRSRGKRRFTLFDKRVFKHMNGYKIRQPHRTVDDIDRPQVAFRFRKLHAVP
ncbi:hypothetical protein QMO17_31830, partial [Klebsiella pneumoniae]|nr:hypothetical protein [Klebsiella pneumoniae]